MATITIELAAENANRREYYDPARLVALANHDYMMVLLPTLVLLFLVVVVGLVGNILVLVVATQRRPMHPAQVYIVALAVTDLLVCVVIIPYQIYALMTRYVVDHYTVGVCKTFEWLKYGAVAASAALLMLIAVDRYLAICRPFFYRQITSRVAAILSTICIVVGLVVPCLKIVLENFDPVDLRTYLMSSQALALSGGLDESLIAINVTVNICHTYHPSSGLVYAYTFLMFLVFLGAVIVPIVAYSLVHREVRKTKHFVQSHAKFSFTTRSTRRRQTQERAASAVAEVASRRNGSVSKNDGTRSRSNTPIIDATSKNNTPVSARKAVSTSGSSTPVGTPVSMRKNQPDLAQKKTIEQFKRQFIFAKVFLVVTMVFVVLWLPFWVVNVLQVAWDDLETTSSRPLLAIMYLAEMLFFINNAINAFIYLGLNSQFRGDVLKLIKRRCRCWGDQARHADYRDRSDTLDSRSEVSTREALLTSAL